MQVQFYCLPSSNQFCLNTTVKWWNGQKRNVCIWHFIFPLQICIINGIWHRLYSFIFLNKYNGHVCTMHCTCISCCRHHPSSHVHTHASHRGTVRTEQTQPHRSLSVSHTVARWFRLNLNSRPHIKNVQLECAMTGTQWSHPELRGWARLVEIDVCGCH